MLKKESPDIDYLEHTGITLILILILDNHCHTKTKIFLVVFHIVAEAMNTSHASLFSCCWFHLNYMCNGVLLPTIAFISVNVGRFIEQSRRIIDNL